MLGVHFTLGRQADAEKLAAAIRCGAHRRAARRRAVKTDRQTAKTPTAGHLRHRCRRRRGGKHAVQAVGDGHFAARAIIAYLAGLPPIKRRPGLELLRPRSHPRRTRRQSRAGLLRPPRGSPPAAHAPMTLGIAHQADRCLRCGCPKQDDCTLREVAAAPERQSHGLSRRPPPPHARRSPPRSPTAAPLTLDNGKCIACGKCVAIAQEAGEPYGLAWISRGFGVHLGPALGVDLATACNVPPPPAPGPAPRPR